jgi:hypothetical protein
LKNLTFYPELEEVQLRRKRELCEDMLRALNILQSGFTARRGNTFKFLIWDLPGILDEQCCGRKCRIRRSESSSESGYYRLHTLTYFSGKGNVCGEVMNLNTLKYIYKM